MALDTLSSPGTRDLGRPGKLTVTLAGGSVDVLAAPHTSSVSVEVREITGPPLLLDDTSGTLRISHRKDGMSSPETAATANGLGGLGAAAGKLGLGSIASFLSGMAERPTARLVLTVPDDLAVSIRTVGASVLVGGTHGAVSVYTVSGGVTFDRCTGSVDVATVSGAIDCGSPSGELKAKTVSGAITVQDAVLRSARLTTVSGRTILDLRHGATLVSAGTVSGALTIRMAADAGYDATVSSTSGHVVVDGEPLVTDGKRGGHRYSGDRSIAIKARTVSGDLVVLRRGTDASADPTSGPVIVEADGPGDVQDEIRRDGTSGGTR